VQVGPVLYNYWNNIKENQGKVLGAPLLVGLDSANIYHDKTYLGGKLAIQVNNLNNELFPTRGIKWNTEFSSLAGISKTSSNITKLSSDMAVYASLSDRARLITVIQLGAGHIFSNHYEFFQAFTLGANNYLQGFRKNRFAGTSAFYSSLEFRLKITDVKSYVLPGALGLIGFNELGRVWLKGEGSGRWHHTIGGGIYYIPFNLAIMSATIGFSQEEHLFNFSIGTKFNLSF
jgi:outer membrane protein assembly factor BamA